MHITLYDKMGLFFMKQEDWRQFVTEFDLSLAVPETVSYTQQCHKK